MKLPFLFYDESSRQVFNLEQVTYAKYSLVPKPTLLLSFGDYDDRVEISGELATKLFAHLCTMAQPVWPEKKDAES